MTATTTTFLVTELREKTFMAEVMDTNDGTDRLGQVLELEFIPGMDGTIAKPQIGETFTIRYEREQ